MQSSDIAQALAGIFAQELNLAVPSVDADLLAGGVLDSVSLVELVLLLEKRFELTIPLEELDFDDLRTIERIAGFLSGRLQARQPGAVT
ncbi:MAG TPA: phosphopantetheine-binding protein [Azospirillaceae bacterium]|nr:phosphopantetheine-binding protein [Azospirillaceae bacterium]